MALPLERTSAMWWKLAQETNRPRPGAFPQVMAVFDDPNSEKKWTNVVMNDGRWKFYAGDGSLVGGPTNNFEEFAPDADIDNPNVLRKLDGIRKDIQAFRQESQGLTPQDQNALMRQRFSKYGNPSYIPEGNPRMYGGNTPETTQPSPLESDGSTSPLRQDGGEQSGQWTGSPASAPNTQAQFDQERRRAYTDQYNAAYQQWQDTGRQLPFNQFKQQFDETFSSTYKPGHTPAAGYQTAQVAPDGSYEAREDGQGGVKLFAPGSQVPYAYIPASQRSAPVNQAYIKRMTGKDDSPQTTGNTATPIEPNAPGAS
jgi:hypothetical protein